MSRRYPYKDQNNSSSIYEVFGNNKNYGADPRYANRKQKSYSNQESSNLNSMHQRYDNSYLPNSNDHLYRNSVNSSFDTDSSPILVYPSRNNDNISRDSYSSSRKTNYISHDIDYLSQDIGNTSLTNNYSSRDSTYSPRNNYSIRKNDFSSSSSNQSFQISSSQKTKFKGIRNICNTCFMNSVLQVLMNLPQFMSDMINSLDKIDMRLGSSSFIKEICRIFYEYVSSQKEFLQVNNFYDILREKIPYLGDGSQHDVAEFFQLFAESCENELLSYISSESRNKHSGEVLLSKTQMLLYDPFMKNFGFSIITSVVCGNCGNAISEEVQTNFILNLPLVSQTLEDCIDKSFDREPIQTSSSKDSDYNPYSYRRYQYDYRYHRTSSHESKSDGYCCSKCRNKSSFYLSTSFYRIPRFLFIQVARFDASLTKNSSPIDVPDRIDLQQYINNNYFAGPEPIRVRNRSEIDMESLYSLETDDNSLYSYQKTARKSRINQNNQNCQSVSEDEKMKRRPSYPDASYHLVSVILHEGTFSAGHYTAAINSQGSRRGWTVISDDIVLENSSFNHSAPYCFIYQID